jgi:hypothetical protein
VRAPIVTGQSPGDETGAGNQRNHTGCPDARKDAALAWFELVPFCPSQQDWDHAVDDQHTSCPKTERNAAGHPRAHAIPDWPARACSACFKEWSESPVVCSKVAHRS